MRRADKDLLEPFFTTERCTIFNRSSESLPGLSPSSVDLVIFSPPYNTRHPYEGYDDDLSPRDYLRLMDSVIGRAASVLRPDGLLVIDIAEVIFWGEDTWLAAWFCKQAARNAGLEELYCLPYIATSDSPDLSFESGTGVVRREGRGHAQTQMVLLYGKSRSEARQVDPSTLARFYSYSGLVNEAFWPTELVRDLISMCIRKNRSHVVDPFLGSGSLGLRCVEQGHHFVGYDVSQAYCERFVRLVDGPPQEEIRVLG